MAVGKTRSVDSQLYPGERVEAAPQARAPPRCTELSGQLRPFPLGSCLALFRLAWRVSLVKGEGVKVKEAGGERSSGAWTREGK